MYFDDLNDDIGADDWLIPRRELTERRVVRQTPRYTIYKADWFGDVLVYEPKKTQVNFSRPDLVSRRHGAKLCEPLSEQEHLKQRLEELSLNIATNDQSVAIATPKHKLAPEQDQYDSAYNSISSTPQFCNKNQREFNFPDQHPTNDDEQQQQVICSPSTIGIECVAQDDAKQQQKQRKSSTTAPDSSPVILNRNSYKFGRDFGDELGSSKANATSGASGSASWFELNELRLVAHENFILFMGASMDDSLLAGECSSQNASLVMETIKPKSVSLFNLLHNTKSTPSRPVSPSLNRFFAANNRQQQCLSVGDKLSICQQVTNALTYLHDKNIVHGRLTSVNIYIETNHWVKISMLDNEEQSIASCDLPHAGIDRHKDVAFNMSTLTYLSPELVRSIRVEETDRNTSSGNDSVGLQKGQISQVPLADKRVTIDASLVTKQADIYSFGTLLFELFEERFPFAEKTTIDDKFMNRLSQSPQSDRTRLFETLCLMHHSPMSSPRSSRYSPHNLDWQEQSSPLGASRDKHWKSNINCSANELIFQIGSGQISARNQLRNKCPALVDHIISACWSPEANQRPSFKQIRFE